MKARFIRFFFLLNLVWPLAACPTIRPEPREVGDIKCSPTVSQEVYDKTFGEILFFIERMEGIITNRDFFSWKAICTNEYIAHFSDALRLKELSQRQYLKDHDIVLNSLEDFFLHVFIPSRTSTTLDKIDFIESDRVKAVTLIGGVPYVVYFLEKDENNQWKISVW